MNMQNMRKLSEHFIVSLNYIQDGQKKIIAPLLKIDFSVTNGAKYL